MRVFEVHVCSGQCWRARPRSMSQLLRGTPAKLQKRLRRRAWPSCGSAAEHLSVVASCRNHARCLHSLLSGRGCIKQQLQTKDEIAGQSERALHFLVQVGSWPIRDVPSKCTAPNPISRNLLMSTAWTLFSPFSAPPLCFSSAIQLV